MSLVVTDAIVLHAFDYLETSRILRLVTREAGVLSALAKGARRNRAKYGSAVDLFAQGEVQIYVKPGRDLHTLAAFDVTTARLDIAHDFDRFAAASAIAELVLRVGRDDPNPALYDVVAETFDQIAAAAPSRMTAKALGGGWRIIGTLGFTPTLDECASCHAPIDPSARVAFSHALGGVLCDRCARLTPNRRILPPEARTVIRTWLTQEVDSEASCAEATLRAHQRLLREFVQEHLTGDRQLRAFTAWEQGDTSRTGQLPSPQAPSH